MFWIAITIQAPLKKDYLFVFCTLITSILLSSAERYSTKGHSNEILFFLKLFTITQASIDFPLYLRLGDEQNQVHVFFAQNPDYKQL